MSIKSCLIVTALLLCVCKGESETSLKWIKSTAFSCCKDGCTDRIMNSLRDAVEIEGRKIYQMESEDLRYFNYAKRVINGTIPCAENFARGHQVNQRSIHPRTVTTVMTIACPPGPYDVGNSSVSIPCTFFANFTTAAQEVYAYATISIGSYGISEPTTYVYFNPPSSDSVTGTIIVTIPMNAPNGTWTIWAVAYSTGSTYDEAYTTIVVKATKNDITPPVLHSVIASIFTPNPYPNGNYLQLYVSDDLSGVASISVYAYSAALAYDLIAQTLYLNLPQKSSLNYTVAFSPYLTTTSAPYGYYSLQIVLLDNVGNQALYLTGATNAAQNITTSLLYTASVCTAGYYLPYNAIGNCMPCPASTYSHNGSFACSACPPGTISAGPAAAACTPCPVGYYSAGAASSTTCTACSPCPAGTYASSPGTGVCVPCSPGQYSTAGSSTCSYCPQGTTSCNGAATCTPCAAGTYATSTSGFYTCMPCPPGTGTPTTGNLQCTLCPVGYYQSGSGATTCTACPKGTSGPAGSTSSLNCA